MSIQEVMRTEVDRPVVDRVAVETTKVRMAKFLAQRSEELGWHVGDHFVAETLRDAIQSVIPPNKDTVYLTATEEVTDDLVHVGPLMESPADVANALDDFVEVYKLQAKVACELAGELAKASLGIAAAQAMYPNAEQVGRRITELRKLSNSEFRQQAARIGDTLKVVRSSKRLTQAKLADTAEVALQFVKKIENCASSLLGSDRLSSLIFNLVKVTRILGIDPVDLLRPQAISPDSQNGPELAEFTIEEQVRSKLEAIRRLPVQEFREYCEKLRVKLDTLVHESRLKQRELGVRSDFVRRMTNCPSIILRKQAPTNKAASNFITVAAALRVDPLEMLEAEKSEKPS